MARFFKRFGTKPYKYNLELEFDKLSINITQKCSVGILCKRGPKKYESKQTYLVNKIADFHQDKIQFQSTLYYHKAKNMFISKSAELHLLFYLPGKTKIGGIYKFNIAAYPTNNLSSVFETIKFEKCPDKNAELRFTINVIQEREIKDNELIDDTSDIESGNLTPLKQSKLSNSQNKKFNFKEEEKQQERISPNFYANNKELTPEKPVKNKEQRHLTVQTGLHTKEKKKNFEEEQIEQNQETLEKELLDARNEIDQLKNENNQLQFEVQKEKTAKQDYETEQNQKVSSLQNEIITLNNTIKELSQTITTQTKTITEKTQKEKQYLLQIQTLNSQFQETQSLPQMDDIKCTQNENAKLKKAIQTLSQQLQEQQQSLNMSQASSLRSGQGNEFKQKYEDLFKKYQQMNFEFEHLKEQTGTDKDLIEELSLANQALEDQLFGNKWKLGQIVNLGFENADAQLLEKIERILVSQNNNSYNEEVNQELSFESN